MFFVLSKLLVFLIRPLTWLFGLLLYASFTRRPERKRRALWATLVLLFVFTNTPLFNLAVSWWEPATLKSIDISEPYDIAVLLGGYSHLPQQGFTDQYVFSERGNRFWNTYELYRRGKVKKIMVTGGGGLPTRQKPNESQEIAKLLEVLGVSPDHIIVEANARNTWENAFFSSRILHRDHPGARLLLVTSAWHLPRAHRCFARNGLEVTPFAVDPLSQPFQWNLRWLLAPRSELLEKWELIIKEWVGMIAYRLKGYA